MTTPRDVTVVICTYAESRWQELAAAVSSVREQSTDAGVEIVLVVDSNPPLLQRVRETYADLVVLANREERGLSGARNSGVQMARGEIVAFLDDDARARPGWLARLLAGYHDPQVLGVGGAAYPDWTRPRPRWLPSEFDWVVGCTYTGLPTRPAPVRNLLGANMSFRRAELHATGGFRSAVGRVGSRPAGCEETELCIRIRQRRPDAVLLYDPGIVVDHKVTPDRGRWTYFRARCYAEGRSKATVARLVGSRDGLASERAYTARVLPRGVARGLVQAARGDLAALSRSAAIVSGVGFAAVGYLHGHSLYRLRSSGSRAGVAAA